MKNDRVFGLIGLGVAVAYIASATQIETSFIMDPLGPKSFPIAIGIILGIASLGIVLRPDPDPVWPSRAIAAKIALSIVLLLAYAFLIKPLGFLVSTAVAASCLSFLIQSQFIRSMTVGVVLSGVLFVIFKFGLGLSLFAWPQTF